MRLSRITKSFGTHSNVSRAVDDVSLTIERGEILAVIGENGAGKTTLMRIAAGELSPDAGEVLRSAQDDIGFVHQHFLLVPELTIAENLALIERRFRFATRKTLEREAVRMIESSGIELHEVSRRVADLSVGEKSKLELIKAIATKPSTLILDEPTSVLTPHESEELFRVMRTLAASGTAIVFISHKLPEVLAIAERIVVMRTGKVVMETREATAESLARAMTPQPPLPAHGERVRVRGTLALSHGNVQIHHHEILAIVGVAGNGQSELAEELRARFPHAGQIPEDRTRDGVIAQMTIAENLALRGVRDAERMIELYSIRALGPRQLAGDLSGGNQQKVVLARELDRRPQIIIAAEPTRGLDIEATSFVHERLRVAAAAGAAILLITSDLDEAFELADAMQVIYRGKLSARMTPEEASSRVANLMAGVA
ncbi:MAG TPA: ATP-binding cassette domain-containing protein [Thermoanaerobaculia bacterium]|nr:ATP-binding cassette domain-containing protein [Thermoanaerobaculia bacterium]